MPDRINRRHSIRNKNTDRNGILNKLKVYEYNNWGTMDQYSIHSKKKKGINGILDRNDSWQYPNDNCAMWLGISNKG